MLHPNEVIEGEGFYISYNASPIGCDSAQGETALVSQPKHGRGTFLILNGDHRAQYALLVPQGYESCLAYYCQCAPTLRSRWSEDQDMTADQLKEGEVADVLLAAITGGLLP
jgi:hypothetical protein